MFDFRSRKKPQMYPLRYIEDFSYAENRRAAEDRLSQQGRVLHRFLYHRLSEPGLTLAIWGFANTTLLWMRRSYLGR